MTERIATYARVSTDEQAGHDTIEAQLHACREHCARSGWGVAAEFRDEGVSGTVPLDERPAGMRLLEAVGEGQFDRVVVHHLDRLARDVVECVRAFKTLRAMGAPVVSASEAWDDTPQGRLIFTIFAAFAEFENGLIRQRMMAGHARGVREGSYFASTTPYGYLRDGRGLKPDPDQAPVVRDIFTWAAVGRLKLREIAERLNGLGIPSPSHARRLAYRAQSGWMPSTLYKIITAPRYVGRGHYAGETMACPALVDEGLFNAAREAIRRRRHPRGRRRVG